MKPSKILKRMEPALGTFVEIGIEEHPQSHIGFQRAFAAIKKVEGLMSFHCPRSQVSQINALKVGEELTAHPFVIKVLKEAEELKTLSRDIFNIAVANTLIQWSLLPFSKEASDDCSANPILIKNNKVLRIGSGLIDLGGIAKGFAVDKAAQGLASLGLCGYVNAGGDVRAFGPKKFSFMIKSGKSFYEIPLTQVSLATSSVRKKYLRKKKYFVSSHVNVSRRPCLKRRTVSVFAESCMVADGLTKVALMANDEILNYSLRYFNAHALIFDSSKNIQLFPKKSF